MKNIFCVAACVFVFHTTIAVARETAKANSSTTPSFIENKGQVTDQYGNSRHDIDYKLQAGGVTLFAGNAQLHYMWSRGNGNDKNNSSPNPLRRGTDVKSPPGDLEVELYRMDVELLGADKNASVIAEDKQGYYENYYTAATPNGVTVHSYKKITYKNVYPHIDWVLYTPQSPKGEAANGVKYDFVVHPGGNPADIRIAYKGATKLEIQDGALVATTPFGSITEAAPYSYWAESKKELSTRFVLNDNILSYNIYSITNHNSQISNDFIIDPDLQWSTYYGDVSVDYFYSHTTDTLGNPVAVGQTNSSTNIASTGSYQTSYGGNVDCMIVKFDPNSFRLWATYFGGTGADNCYDVACDTGANIFICGRTSSSTGIATTGSFQSSYGGGTAADAYIAKFNAAGIRQWGTYYGNTGDERFKALACDAAGNVIVAGASNTIGLATTGSHQPSYSGGTLGDALLVKFSPSGARLWATYYGSSLAGEYIYSVASDRSSNIYFSGFAGNSTGTEIATAGTFFPSFGTGTSTMLVKFNSSGVRQWGTYYYGEGYGVCPDASGNVYLVGGEVGSGPAAPPGISTTGAFQTTAGGGSDGYIAKFNSSGNRLWGTFYGGSGGDLATGVCYNALTGNIYVCGGTNSTNALFTANGYKTSNNGFLDNFIAEFTPAGNRLWASFFGGIYNEVTGAITNDGARISTSNYTGKFHLSGSTVSPSGLAVGGYQTTWGGNDDGYLATFYADTIVYIVQPYTDTLFCAGDSVHINYNVSTPFRNGNVFTLQLSNAAGSFASPTVLGTRTDIDSGIIHGKLPITLAGGTGYRVRIVASMPVRTSNDDGVNIRIKPVAANRVIGNNNPCEPDTLRLTASTTSSPVTFAWTGPNSFSSTQQNPKIGNTIAGTHSGSYIITMTLNGCVVKDTMAVTVKPLPAKPTAGSNTPLCTGAILNLTSSTTTSGVTYSWSGPAAYTASTQNPIRTSMTTALAGDYIVTVTLNGCIAKDTETVVVYAPTTTPIASNTGPYCVGSTVQLNAGTIAGASYAWTGPGFSSTLQNPTITAAGLAAAGTYSVIATVNGCASNAATTTVSIVAGPTVAIYPSPNDSICLGTTVTFTAIPNNPGTNPQYQWLKNGIALPGGTTLSFPVTGLIDGDIISFLLTPGSGASCTTPVNSNFIPMTVLQYQQPIVEMVASDTTIWPGLLVNFNVTNTSGGANPKYQWKVNNQNIIGATNVIWGTTQLNNNDKVCVVMTPDFLCPNPATATACATIHVSTGIGKLSNSQLKVYPNPVKETLTVEGITTGTQLQMTDVLGRTVYSGTAQQATTTINIKQLPAGNYMLQLTYTNGTRDVVKVVKE